MISSLKKTGQVYRCTNCMFRQPTPLLPNCPYCGNLFSNYEELIIKEQIEKQAGEISEQHNILS